MGETRTKRRARLLPSGPSALIPPGSLPASSCSLSLPILRAALRILSFNAQFSYRRDLSRSCPQQERAADKASMRADVVCPFPPLPVSARERPITARDPTESRPEHPIRRKAFKTANDIFCAANNQVIQKSPTNTSASVRQGNTASAPMLAVAVLPCLTRMQVKRNGDGAASREIRPLRYRPA